MPMVFMVVCVCVCVADNLMTAMNNSLSFLFARLEGWQFTFGSCVGICVCLDLFVYRCDGVMNVVYGLLTL